MTMNRLRVLLVCFILTTILACAGDSGSERTTGSDTAEALPFPDDPELWPSIRA